MNRTAFSLPEHSEYRTSGGLAISRAVEQFTGNAKRLDDLIELLDRRRGVVLSSGTMWLLTFFCSDTRLHRNFRSDRYTQWKSVSRGRFRTT